MIIITGASRGIGKYLFEKFGKENRFGTYFSTKPENKTFLAKVDITDYSQIIKWINAISASNVILINCAGVNYNSFAHKADIDKWKRIIDVNIVGTFNMIRAILPIMREQKYGRIINLSSVVGQMGVLGTSAYAASKAALTGMIKSIAIENATKGITINNLNLGYYDIGMIQEIPAEVQDIIKSKIPTGNFGTPENILKAVKFLIETDYINGTSIDINGGL